MRRAPALYERHLWRLLRDRRLNGLKFRRQVVIDRFIVDFVCLRHRLIVEADGPFHVEEADADREMPLALSIDEPKTTVDPICCRHSHSNTPQLSCSPRV